MQDSQKNILVGAILQHLGILQSAAAAIGVSLNKHHLYGMHTFKEYLTLKPLVNLNLIICLLLSFWFNHASFQSAYHLWCHSTSYICT